MRASHFLRQRRHIKSVGRNLFCTLFLMLLLWETACAHPAEFTTLQVKVEADGHFEATLNIDILSFALGQTSARTSNEELEALLGGPRATLAADLAHAGEHFRHEVVVRTDAGNAAINQRAAGVDKLFRIVGADDGDDAGLEEAVDDFFFGHRELRIG